MGWGEKRAPQSTPDDVARLCQFIEDDGYGDQNLCHMPVGHEGRHAFVRADGTRGEFGPALGDLLAEQGVDVRPAERVINDALDGFRRRTGRAEETARSEAELDEWMAEFMASPEGAEVQAVLQAEAMAPSQFLEAWKKLATQGRVGIDDMTDEQYEAYILSLPKIPGGQRGKITYPVPPMRYPPTDFVERTKPPVEPAVPTRPPQTTVETSQGGALLATDVGVWPEVMTVNGVPTPALGFQFVDRHGQFIRHAVILDVASMRTFVQGLRESANEAIAAAEKARGKSLIVPSKLIVPGR